MGHSATTDPDFLKTVEHWCRVQPEVLALIRNRCGGGSKEFRLFSSFPPLLELIHAQPAGTCITVFRQPNLPLRGVVDERFVEQCLKVIPDGIEYLVFDTVPTVAGKRSWYHYGSGISHAELREDLDQSVGLAVVAGFYPPMLGGPSEAVDGVVADPDGVVRAGPY